jgi:hypothetical protein
MLVKLAAAVMVRKRDESSLFVGEPHDGDDDGTERQRKKRDIKNGLPLFAALPIGFVEGGLGHRTGSSD